MCLVPDVEVPSLVDCEYCNRSTEGLIYVSIHKCCGPGKAETYSSGRGGWACCPTQRGGGASIDMGDRAYFSKTRPLLPNNTRVNRVSIMHLVEYGGGGGGGGSGDHGHGVEGRHWF